MRRIRTSESRSGADGDKRSSRDCAVWTSVISTCEDNTLRGCAASQAHPPFRSSLVFFFCAFRPAVVFSFHEKSPRSISKFESENVAANVG